MYQALIRFEEAFFERIWGGHRLRNQLRLAAPADRPIGEAWLISDHDQHESVVAKGPWAGRTLHELLVNHRDYLLGTQARPTVHGRFPLLLKILDAADVLSVQVHPDDAAALAMNEPDVGKTEMWHVLDSEPGSSLICGLDPALTREGFLAAVADNTIAGSMRQFPAPPGTTAFVAAGTVHAIGAGILLAEIQQNSDLTYRIYDWDRVDGNGQRRELHLEKAARVTRFGSDHGGAATPLDYVRDGVTITVLGACAYFANQLIRMSGHAALDTAGRSFHIVMPRDRAITVTAANETIELAPCRAVLIPAGVGPFQLEGEGSVLHYFVPDLDEDVYRPLMDAGHDRAAIDALGPGLAHGTA